jgi:CheY-like chemotaxis protein
MTSAASASPPPILVVEDETLIRINLALELETAGFTVCEVTTAVEALALLQTGLTVSAIITDLRMPGPVDGRDLATWASQNRPGVPVIVASGYPADLSEGQHLDGAAFVSKPYDPAGLVNLLQNLTTASP